MGALEEDAAAEVVDEVLEDELEKAGVKCERGLPLPFWKLLLLLLKGLEWRLLLLLLLLLLLKGRDPPLKFPRRPRMALMSAPSAPS